MHCFCEGEFGVVYRSHLTGWQGRTTAELVAVKTLKSKKHPAPLTPIQGWIQDFRKGGVLILPITAPTFLCLVPLFFTRRHDHNLSTSPLC